MYFLYFYALAVNIGPPSYILWRRTAIESKCKMVSFETPDLHHTIFRHEGSNVVEVKNNNMVYEGKLLWQMTLCINSFYPIF